MQIQQYLPLQDSFYYSKDFKFSESNLNEYEYEYKYYLTLSKKKQKSFLVRKQKEYLFKRKEEKEDFKNKMEGVNYICADILYTSINTYEVLIYCFLENRETLFDLGLYLKSFFGFKTQKYSGYILNKEPKNNYEEYRIYNPIVLSIPDDTNLYDNEAVHSIAQKLSKFLDKKIVWEDEF